MARGLKFQIKKVEGLYYLCSENKGADQLRGKCEADLRLCFRICKKPVFSRRCSIVKHEKTMIVWPVRNHVPGEDSDQLRHLPTPIRVCSAIYRLTYDSRFLHVTSAKLN